MGTPILLVIGPGSTSDLLECDNLTFTIIHYCLKIDIKQNMARINTNI